MTEMTVICPTCHGMGYSVVSSMSVSPCLECMGSGVSSCCDAAGAGFLADKCPCGLPWDMCLWARSDCTLMDNEKGEL